MPGTVTSIAPPLEDATRLGISAPFPMLRIHGDRRSLLAALALHGAQPLLPVTPPLPAAAAAAGSATGARPGDGAARRA
jgi:hypothetical protein